LVTGIGVGLLAALAPPAALAAASPAPTLSPQTQVSVLGVSPARIVRVTVRGSRTGRHVGRLQAYSSGVGASFVPARSFSPGERVHVTLDLRGRQPLAWSFGVARPVALVPVLHPPAGTVLDLRKLDHFTSAPGLLAPTFTPLRRSPSLHGDLLITPLPSPNIHPGSKNTLRIKVVGPGGPMIVAPNGRLVWFDQLPAPMVAANLQMQHYGGHSVLTWWQGGVEPDAFGVGEGMIADHSYRVVATVRAGNGYQADVHEFQLLPGRRAMLTAYAPMRVTIVNHGRREHLTALNSVVQEIDVPTGLVMWEWDAFGHIPLGSTYAPAIHGADWDPYHLNSIQPLGGGRMLVSARDTSAVYDIDQASGRILWTLGGKRSSFRLGPGARFWFQHDAHLDAAGGQVSLFDDEAGPPAHARSSRGLMLSLNAQTQTAAVVRSLRRATPTLANSLGSLQALPGGQALVGFGSTRYVSAFDRRGRLVYDAELAQGDSTYRAFLADWHATPSTPPVAVSTVGADGSTLVHVSWNGATEVARWEVLAAGRTVTSAPDSGFETTIAVPAGLGSLSVRALTAGGRALGPVVPVTG
jgi:hypothetical protein